VHAIRQRRLTRMVAYSSVAQIGYIFLGISLGTEAGMAAAVYHILAHSAAKAMLFLSANRLREASGDEDTFAALGGSALRAPLAGLAFTVGACSLVGIPGLGGFTSKLYLASAGVEAGGLRMAIVLAALAISTLLNVAYMLRSVLVIYRKKEETDQSILRRDGLFAVAAAALTALTLLLGLLGGPILQLIEQGIRLFA